MLDIKEYPTLHIELVKDEQYIKLYDTDELLQVLNSIKNNLNIRLKNSKEYSKRYKNEMLYDLFKSYDYKERKNILDTLSKVYLED